MNLHANAKLGLAGRRRLVEAIDAGMTLRQAAACFSVSPATVHRWWHRWVAAGRVAEALRDRSSRPHRQPRRLSTLEEQRIIEARRQTNLGPGRLAGILRRARSTIWKVLWRHGLSRRPLDLPRPGTARLLPDPRPETPREGREEVLPRPRGGNRPDARNLRTRRNSHRGSHWRLARPPAA